MGALYDFLFGKSKYQVNNEYQNALKDAGAQRAKAVEQAVQDRKTYDANKDYFTKMGVKDPGYASDVSKAYADEMGKIEDARKQAWKENRYKNDGTGMIGALTTPYYHTADFAKDLFTGNLGNRYSGGGEYGAADPLSDLGALGEVAFDVAGMGALGNAVRGGTKLMSNVGKTALRTGLLGAGENAFSTLREGGSNTNLGDLALSAGIGGVVGGGLGGLSQLGGNAANIAKTVRSPQMKTLNNYYQQALAGQAMPLNASRMLGDGVGGFGNKVFGSGAVRNLVDYQSLVVNDTDFSAVADLAALCAVIVAAHIDGAAGREVGVDLEILAAQDMYGSVNQLVEVVGQDEGGHAHADALHALGEQQRELDGQRDGLAVTAVVGNLPLGGLVVEDHLLGERGETRLDVTGSRRIVASENVTPVTLRVDEQVLLAHLHQCCPDGLVAVGVVLHGVTHDVRHLVEAAVFQLVHGV